MGTTGNAIISDVEARVVADGLDGLHAYELFSALWVHAVKYQLSGTAVYLLPAELDEQTASSRANAERLAERIAQLGAAPTCDPSSLLILAGVDAFKLPSDTSDPSVVVRHALAYQQAAIRACHVVLRSVEGKDVVTARLLTEMLSEKVKQEDEMESSLRALAVRG